jgi:pilus assembly protein Flp/PilA
MRREREGRVRKDSIARFLSDDAAATSIEYAVIGAFISIIFLTGARAIGTKISSNFYGPVVNGFN